MYFSVPNFAFCFPLPWCEHSLIGSCDHDWHFSSSEIEQGDWVGFRVRKNTREFPRTSVRIYTNLHDNWMEVEKNTSVQKQRTWTLKNDIAQLTDATYFTQPFCVWIFRKWELLLCCPVTWSQMAKSAAYVLGKFTKWDCNASCGGSSYDVKKG